MSDIEYACRESLWYAYAQWWWAQSRGGRCEWLAYGWALGLEVP